MGAGGVAAGEELAIRVIRESFEDGGQCLHHLLELHRVFGVAREIFLLTGVLLEVIELVGVEGDVVAFGAVPVFVLDWGALRNWGG